MQRSQLLLKLARAKKNNEGESKSNSTSNWFAILHANTPTMSQTETEVILPPVDMPDVVDSPQTTSMQIENKPVPCTSRAEDFETEKFSTSESGDFSDDDIDADPNFGDQENLSSNSSISSDNSSIVAGPAEWLAVGAAEGLAGGPSEGIAEIRAEGLAAGPSEGLTESRAEGLVRVVSSQQTPKRKANPKYWKKNMAKRLRNSGKSYQSNSKSARLIRGREMGPPCDEKCRLGCSKKFTENDRKLFFSTYWEMGDLQRQREFLARSIEPLNTKYRYIREEPKRAPRKKNNCFFFQLEDKKIRVCKLFFVNTLAVTSRAIRTIVEKVESSAIAGITPIEKRGKHGKHLQLDEAIKQSVRDHISTIPRIESHYCRQNSTREYIDGSKSIAEIHRDYVSNCKNKDRPFACYQMFRKIFKSEHNISFFRPKKDQCEDCMAFENADAQTKETLREKYDAHLVEKELSRKEKDADKKNDADNIFVGTYDLQAVLPCPRGDVSGFYYTSKLSVFDFTICNLKDTNDVRCFVWFEGDGQRGANEIGTCVLKKIEELEEISKRIGKPLDVIFYTDNCCGQNKNQFIFALYRYAVFNFEFINSITHKFLVKGHTQNEGDSVHSVIERHISRSLRGGPIYKPEHYYTLIRSAKKSGQPYKVSEMAFSNFLNIKNLDSEINFGKNSVKITDIRIIKFEKAHPKVVYYKKSFSETSFSEIEIRSSRKVKKDTENLVPLYKAKLPIAEKKKKGLLMLLEKNLIPQYYSDFYKNL